MRNFQGTLKNETDSISVAVISRISRWCRELKSMYASHAFYVSCGISVRYESCLAESLEDD